MLHSILMPTWLHFASQNRSKIHENVDPKSVPIMHPFSLRFWIPKTSLLGPNLEPSWPSVSHQDGPRSFPDPPQEASQTELGASLVFKVATRRPRRPPSPPLAPFGLDFGVSGLDFQGFWLPFSSHFFIFLDCIFSTTLALC